MSGFRTTISDQHDWGIGSRAAWSRSYRFAENLELGFEFTWADVLYQHPSDQESLDIDPSGRTSLHMLYGVRIGVKYRIVSFVNPRGEGIEAAVFATHRPQLSPGFSLISEGESTRLGGMFIGEDDEDVDPDDARIESTVPRATSFGITAGYQARRILVDLSLVNERVTTAEDSLLGSYPGVSAGVGARYRVTPGLAIGLSLWGNGNPPWHNEAQHQAVDRQSSTFGFVLGFGAKPGAGTQIMVSSPTRDFGDSIRVFFSMVTTR